MTNLSEANAKFAADFFHRLNEAHPCDNILFSPVNLTAALGLLRYASACEQGDHLEKILHWDELKECERPRSRRHLEPPKSAGRSASRLTSGFKVQEKDRNCPKSRPRPEPACPKSRPQPEPEKPCDSRRTIHRPPPCPEPEEAPRPCPERDVPCYECENPEAVHTAFSKILEALNKPSTNVDLSIANKLYGDHSIAFIQKFLYCALKLYLTEVNGVDFHNAPEEVRRLINLWVEIETHGKIKDLLPKDSFDCLTQLLHVNALYFKGQWEVKFDENLTEEAQFYAHDDNEGDCLTVQLMQRKGVYNTGTVDFCGVQVQVLEIPYKDNEFSFFILLPVDCSREALQQLEDGLSYDKLLDRSCDLKPEEVNVAIPKFNAEKSLEANKYLDLEDLSDPEKANFTEATLTEGVALTHLIHDAFIEIDEEGGEEAEAPHCPRDRRRREPISVRADHPFLYYILHNCTQSIIALGRFSKPE